MGLGEYAAAFKKGAHVCVEGARAGGSEATRDINQSRSREYESKAPRGEKARIPAERGNSSGEHACACGADREITIVRTYDIVASSIINLRAGQRNTVRFPDEAAA
jgi:hypothetical protein